MSEDIVARLRAGSYLYNEETRNTEHIITKNERLAADEIERLRGEVERLTLERDYWARARNEWEKSAGLLEEENKRLTRERDEAREVTDATRDGARVNTTAMRKAVELAQEYKSRAAAAEAKVAKLRAALEFYSNKMTYTARSGVECGITRDHFGDRARTALQETEQ